MSFTVKSTSYRPKTNGGQIVRIIVDADVPAELQDADRREFEQSIAQYVGKIFESAKDSLLSETLSAVSRDNDAKDAKIRELTKELAIVQHHLNALRRAGG